MILLKGVGSSQVPVVSQLSAADYWADGTVSLAPNVGNYTSSTVLSDGSLNDTTTGETASGNVITVVRVDSSNKSIATWDQTLFYKGTMTSAYSYWDGSAWQSMSDTNITLFPVHNISYTNSSRQATFSGVASAKIWRCVMTQGTGGAGNAECTDSRTA